MTPSLVRLPKDEFRARGYHAISTPFFLLKTKKNSTARRRLGVVVGKGVNKSAGKRNFWKRQVKEVSRKELGIGSDLLIVISPGVNSLTKRDFRAELSKAIGKIKK